MPQTVRGVIARAKGAPVEIVDVVVPDPGPGEAVVQVQACGVCHTDLHYREGGINDEFPFLLGHEAAGVVEAVGDHVTSVSPGDFVVLNWRAVCGDPVAAIQELTGGNGADVVIDAVGRPETWRQAFYARDLAGTVVLVGVPTPDMTLQMPLIDFFSRGGALKSSWYGDCLPERDFPTLISLYTQGRLPLEKFVSERIGLDQVEDAFHKMHAGEVLRSVVVF